MPASTPIHSDALNYPVRLIDPRGPGDKMTNVQYEHPPLIKSQINAWTQSVNAAAVVTALFAGTAAQLFGIVISSSFNPGHTRSFLILSSYAAMIFNALATMASIVLIDRLGDIELHGATMEPTTPQTGVYRNVRNLELLLEYGARASFKYIFCQWILYMFLGTFFMFMQIVVLMWMREAHGLAIPVMIVTCVAITMLGWSALQR